MMDVISSELFMESALALPDYSLICSLLPSQVKINDLHAHRAKQTMQLKQHVAHAGIIIRISPMVRFSAFQRDHWNPVFYGPIAFLVVVFINAGKRAYRRQQYCYQNYVAHNKPKEHDYAEMEKEILYGNLSNLIFRGPLISKLSKR